LKEPEEPVLSSTSLRLAQNGVTLKQLLQFREHYDTGQKLTKDIVRDVILPQTVNPIMETTFCYMHADFMKRRGGKKPAQTLVSHAWEAPFENTIRNIVLDATGWTRHELLEAIKAVDEPQPMKLEESIAKKNAPALDKVYWLDIFAVNQHASMLDERVFPWPANVTFFSPPKPKGGEIACEVDKLHEVVQIVGRVLVSLDPELKTLTRLWVHTEIAEAVKAGKPVTIRMVSGVAKEATVKMVRGEFILPLVKDAKYGNKDDYDRTIDKIDAVSGGQVAFNELLRAMVDLRFGRCSILDRDSSADAAIKTTETLEMNCTWCAKEQNSTRDLESLTELAMGPGFKKFKGLRHFAITFNRCVGLKSCEELGLGLAELPALLSLRLDFRYCLALQNVSTVGAALGKMTALTSLHVDMAYCSALTSVKEFGMGLAHCVKLTNLYLDLGYLTSLTSGVEELGAALPALTKVELLYLDLEQLNESHVTTVSKSLATLKEIPECAVDFRGCGIQWRGPCAMAHDITTVVGQAVARAASRRKSRPAKRAAG
jgi:hypothetical protein